MLKRFFLFVVLAWGMCAIPSRSWAFELLNFLECSPNEEPANICFSHTEGKGLGYTEGYTSLDLFLAQPLYQEHLVSFVDLRGHIFNNGRLASNAGLGLRWLDNCCQRIWGINAFYDSLETSHRSYHQVAFGLEALSETWDMRVTGYLPVGHHKTSLYKFTYESLSPTDFLLKGREQLSFKGFDAEVGYHFCNQQRFNLYAGAGPYCYWGRSAETKNAFRHTPKYAVGGRIRASACFLNYATLDATTTYDARFKWGGQVTLALNIPFDFPWSQKTYCGSDCSLAQRLYQPVVRNEIIVTDRISRYSTNPLVLDPEFEP